MNRSESPSTALPPSPGLRRTSRAPSPPLGEKDGMRGYGSWEASTISESRIGTMNQRRTGARTALSASASDLIRADMAVRAPTAGSWRGSIADWARQLNRNVTRFGNDKFFDLDGNRVERELSQDHLCDVRRQPL